MDLSRDQLVARVIRAGELDMSGEDQPEMDSYFDTRQFRFHDHGRFVEEWVRTDYRSFLRQLGAPGR